jgi:hypothetical protein
LPRENQSEHNHETINDISSNKNATHLSQSSDSTKHIQTQEKPLEKDIEVSDGEKLKKELFKKQADLIMNHRRRLGRDNKLFKEQFSIDPARAIDAQSKIITDLKLPLQALEQEHMKSLNPVQGREEFSKQDALNEQYSLIMNFKKMKGLPTSSFEKHFDHDPEQAIKSQKGMDRNIKTLLEGGVPISSPSKGKSDDLNASVTATQADSSKSTEASKTVERNKEQEAQIDKGPSLER